MSKALKTLYKLHWRTPTKQVHKIAGRFNIEQIIYMEKLKFIYKILHGMTKSNKIYVTNADVHTHNTRTRDNLRLNTTRTERGRQGLINSSADLFNKLSEEIKNSNNLRVFMSAIADNDC